MINSFASKYGLESEKGTILGIFRSLQALARATGPLIASFGKIASRSEDSIGSFCNSSLLVYWRTDHVHSWCSLSSLSMSYSLRCSTAFQTHASDANDHRLRGERRLTAADRHQNSYLNKTHKCLSKRNDSSFFIPSFHERLFKCNKNLFS